MNPRDELKALTDKVAALKKALKATDLSNYYNKAEVDALLAAQDELSELDDVDIPAPADTEVLTYHGASSKWKSAAGGGGGGELNDGSIFGHRLSGQYYTSQITCLSGSPRAAQTKDNLRACPFLVSKSQTFDRIGTNVTGVVDAKLRLGIYDSNAAGYPNNLILDSGELDSSVTGDVEAVINETLPIGLYWLAHLGSKDQSIRTLLNDICIAVMGFDDMGNTQPSLSWHVAQAYGALPDPFTGGGTTKEWSACVAVYLRKS